MTHAQSQKRHAELVAEIHRHDHAYYVEGRQLVTDHEYDQLFQELQKLEMKGSRIKAGVNGKDVFAPSFYRVWLTHRAARPESFDPSLLFRRSISFRLA